MLRFVAALVALASAVPDTQAQSVPSGFLPRAKVDTATRLDWVFSLANQSPAEPPADWLGDYDSTKQTFERFVPARYDSQQATPLVIYISPGNAANGFNAWRQSCERGGFLFAAPHQAGNGVPPQRRIRIVMDVLDQMKRDFNVDPDRTYLAGFSGGGRIACGIAFALPEYFGGVIPICAGGDLRAESWLRQRVVDRLSVALLTGETDFNRAEVRMWKIRHSGVGVRTKEWIVPRLGHGIPNATVLTQALSWLDEGVASRRKLAKAFPASSQADPLDRAEWAKQLLAEAEKRVQAGATRYSGLMQLKGIRVRWDGLPEAKRALSLLLTYDARDERPWEKEDIAEQRRFLIAQARGADSMTRGRIDKRYERLRPRYIRTAIQLWELVVADGQDRNAVAEAKRRLSDLKAELERQ